MNYLHEQHIALFLAQVFVLIGCARIAGELLRRWNQPSIIADIMVGVVLGPTLLGRLAPGLQQALFPHDPVQMKMLETVAWLGLFFFLLETGLEMDFSSAWRQRGDALRISLADLIIPMLIAFVPCLLLPAGYIGQAGGRLGFALFIAAIMTISALPATARVLQDLHMYKTDLGFLIMCALSVNDILGWLVFTLILGFFTQTELSGMRVLVILGATCGFTVFCLTLGRALANRGISALKRRAMPEPGSSLTLLVLLGLLCGAITAWIGIHALFGFFIAGIMAGEARELSERTRQVIAQMVHAIFIPIFFASIGLKLDVVASFDGGLVAFMLVIGIAGRYAGAWCGVATTRQPRENRHLIAIAHVPGGEMQIVVSLLALQNMLIRESVFVAVVCSAVVSSIIVGPWMTLALRRRKAVHVLEYCARERVVEVSARTRDAALRELCACAADALPGVAPEALYDAVQHREDEMGTGIGHGLAVPHARLRGVTRPVLVIGRARLGIEWNAPDGDPARLLFLLLTPAEDADVQLQALRIIATAFADADLRARVQDAADARDVWRVVQEALQAHTIVRRA